MNFEEALQIVEGNELQRFVTKHSNKGYAIVSACRGELSEKENRARTAELKTKLQASKFSFKAVNGGFIENYDKPNQKEVYENSFMIYNYDKDGKELPSKELFRYALKICKEYGQDSILYSEEGKEPLYYKKDGTKDFAPGNSMKFNDKKRQYFTEFGKNKRFSLTDD